MAALAKALLAAALVAGAAARNSTSDGSFEGSFVLEPADDGLDEDLIPAADEAEGDAPGTVTAVVSVPVLIGDIAVGSDARADFETNFKADVASILDIDAGQITINGITAGSVNVDFSVAPDADGTPATSPAAVTEGLAAGVSFSALNVTSTGVDGAAIATAPCGERWVVKYTDSDGREKELPNWVCPNDCGTKAHMYARVLSCESTAGVVRVLSKADCKTSTCAGPMPPADILCPDTASCKVLMKLPFGITLPEWAHGGQFWAAVGLGCVLLCVGVVFICRRKKGSNAHTKLSDSDFGEKEEMLASRSSPPPRRGAGVSPGEDQSLINESFSIGDGAGIGDDDEEEFRDPERDFHQFDGGDESDDTFESPQDHEADQFGQAAFDKADQLVVRAAV